MLEAVEPPAPEGMARTAESDASPGGARPPGERRRVRKKLSFREPEIVGCEKYRQLKEGCPADETGVTRAGRRGEAEGAAEPPVTQEEPLTGRQRGGSVTQEEPLTGRQRGGSLDSQLSVRLVLRPGAGGGTSVHTERERPPPSPQPPRPPPAHSPSLGSMDDLQLQEHALQVVQSVGRAFELSQSEVAAAAAAAAAAAVPRPSASPVRQSPSDSEDSASGGDTPQPADVLSTPEPEPPSPLHRSPPAEAVSVTVTPPPSPPPAGERPSRRPQRLSRSPDKRQPPSAAVGRRHHSVPRPARTAEGRGLQRLSPLVSSRAPPMFTGLPSPCCGRRQEPSSVHHQIQLVCSQLAQQRQQTQAAQAQVSLVRQQLQAETAARLQAQRRSHQLLEHNRQLLEHVQQLIGELHQMQAGRSSGTVSPESVASLSSEETGRAEPQPDAGLQLLWELERLAAPSGSFGAEPLSPLDPFGSAPPSPLSRTDPLLSDLSELAGMSGLSAAAGGRYGALYSGVHEERLGGAGHRHYCGAPSPAATLRRSGGGGRRTTATCRHGAHH